MHEWLNNIRQESGFVQNVISQVLCGLVTSYNPDNCSVLVSIQPVDDEDPNGAQSGWIPVATDFIGMVGAPNIGDQVVIAFQEGNLNTGIVIGRLYSVVDIPPSVPSGEWWLTHPSGSFIKVFNNGNIEIQAAAEVTINGATQVNISAAASISLNAPSIALSNGGSVQQIVNDAMVTFFNTHTHGLGPVPDQTMGAGQLSTIVKVQ